MSGKPKLDVENPGAWGTAGSLVKNRGDVEAVCSAADALRVQLGKGTLDPDSVQKHVIRIESCLKVLKEHALNPTKYS